MVYLIDGFNLIYKFPDLEGLMYQGRLSDARRGLLEKLKEYIKLSGDKVRIVFDGKKEKLLEIKNERVGTIDIYYSLDYSADFLIKQFIKKDLNPRMTTVVTSDKDIVRYVTRYRARVKTSEEFAEMLTRAMEKWIEEQIPEKEDDPKLDKEEIAFWERLFRGRKKQPPES
ncbi:MAG: NYN domain-containing protein [Spirochaetota bacterium]|jgi:predicted RNA-binding protein with PIN domain